jgi:hypothetical protein
MELVAVYTAIGEIEAEAIKCLLESMEIPAMISGESYGRLMIPNFGGGGIADVKVLVREEDAERAREIIEETRIEPYIPDEEDDEDE